MKKLNLKKNGNFSVVSHTYILYGHKYGNTCYIHLETPTCYMISSFPWGDVLKLIRDKLSWKEFAGIVSYEQSRQEEEYYNL